MNEPSDELFRHALGKEVGGWSECGGGGVAGLPAFVLRFVLFFVVVVVDVLVVQVVDVGLSSSWTRLLSCPLLCETGIWSRQCSPWSSAVAVLGQRD